MLFSAFDKETERFLYFLRSLVTLVFRNFVATVTVLRHDHSLVLGLAGTSFGILVGPTRHLT